MNKGELQLNKLIITEKPSVAQAIAAVVGAITRKDGYFEGNGYVVGWCLGHLAQLVSAEAYDPRLSRWRVADLPILPHDWRYRVPQDKRKQFGILRGLMLRDDVSQVINACDAGREGELIFRNLNYLTGCTKPTLRLWLNSMEEAEIRRALGDLRPGSDYDRLFAAATRRLARRHQRYAAALRHLPPHPEHWPRRLAHTRPAHAARGGHCGLRT